MTLYIHACPREDSRTRRLAQALLDNLRVRSEQSTEHESEYQELDLTAAGFQPLNADRLAYRTAEIEAGRFDDPIFDAAKQFASADTIVIAAPFWDLSFPALLKIYLENIYVTGIVSKYGEDGRPVGLCKAQKLYYVTTAGGPFDGRFSFDYITALAKTAFGIPETVLVKAEMLDIVGNDPEKILMDELEHLREHVKTGEEARDTLTDQELDKIVGGIRYPH